MFTYLWGVSLFNSSVVFLTNENFGFLTFGSIFSTIVDLKGNYVPLIWGDELNELDS